MASSSRSEPQRPLSPNIQLYRPQLTSVLSILNRLTGVLLSIAADRARDLASGSSRGTASLRHRASGARLLDRASHSVRMHVRVFSAFLRWHPTSCLGHRTRI